jgi:hypothetical protein
MAHVACEIVVGKSIAVQQRDAFQLFIADCRPQSVPFLDCIPN